MREGTEKWGAGDIGKSHRDHHQCDYGDTQQTQRTCARSDMPVDAETGHGETRIGGGSIWCGAGHPRWDEECSE